MSINTQATGGMEYFAPTAEQTKIAPAGQKFQGQTEVVQINDKASGGMQYSGFTPTEKIKIDPSGQKFQGQAVVINPHVEGKSGDSGYTAFDSVLTKTDVEKKGAAYTGEKKAEKLTHQSGGTAYSAFPTESTAVPKKGKPWVPKTVVQPINAERSGGSSYVDPVAAKKQ